MVLERETDVGEVVVADGHFQAADEVLERWAAGPGRHVVRLDQERVAADREDVGVGEPDRGRGSAGR